MYSHDGTWNFLRMIAVMGFIILSVWWLQGAIGQHYTLLIIFALVGVIIFAGGAMFAHMNQKQTLNALTNFNRDDAQVDRYRQQSFKALASGEAALRKAQAQLTVIDARRVDRLAQQQSKLLVDTERQRWEVQQRDQPPATSDTWTWDDDDAGGNDFQEWQ